MGTCPRCTPSGRPSLSPWSPTTRSLLTSRASRRSRTSSSSLIGPCWSLTRGKRAQEVWWSRSQSKIPEVLPLNLCFLLCRYFYQHLGNSSTTVIKLQVYKKKKKKKKKKFLGVDTTA